MHERGMGSFYVWQVELHWKTVISFVNLLIYSLALLEMRIALAKLIWHYDITLNNGQKTPKFSSLWMTVTNLEIRVRKVDRGD